MHLIQMLNITAGYYHAFVDLCQ